MLEIRWMLRNRGKMGEKIWVREIRKGWNKITVYLLLLLWWFQGGMCIKMFLSSVCTEGPVFDP